MSVKDKRDEIRQRLIGAQPSNALLVEGDDDKAAFRTLLARFLPDWERRWVIEAAGNKRQLLELLKLEPDWLGLVDRDEWDDGSVIQRTSEQPNLMVLPRFCLENYLIDPAELWLSIPSERQATIGGGQPEFESFLLRDLPKFVRHGVLWKVVTPLWSGLRALGFKEALASENSVAAAQDNAAIQRALRDWNVLLDPVRIYDEFQTQLQAVQELSTMEQLHIWVHGKSFWRHAVNPGMDKLFGKMAEKDRRSKIFRKLPAWPTDIDFLLERLK